jgi:hypothetical protein
LDLCGEEEPQASAHLCLPQGQRRDRGICLGKTGMKIADDLKKKLSDLGVNYGHIARDD